MIFAAMLTWAKGFSLRQYLEVAAVVGLIVFILWWDHLKIQQGRDECEASHVAAQAAADKNAKDMQVRIDAAASRDAALQAALNEQKPIIPAVALPASCRYTQAQIDALRKVLQ